MNNSHFARNTTRIEMFKRNHICFNNPYRSIGFLMLFLFLCSNVLAFASDYDRVYLSSGEMVANDFPFPDPSDGFAIVDNPLPFSGELFLEPFYVYIGPEVDIAAYDDAVVLWNTQLTNAKEVFKQIGITIEAPLAPIMIPERQVDDTPVGKFNMAKQNKHLMAYTPKAENVAPVFLVYGFEESSIFTETSGQTITTWLAEHRPEFETNQSGCFIAYGHEINWDTLAHELGHLLLNDRFFYRSDSYRDGLRVHLKDNTHLMSLYRETSIIDFNSVVKDKYAPNTIEDIRKSRMNHIEAMYYRTPYIRIGPDDFYGYSFMQILMPQYSITEEETDQDDSNEEEHKVYIGARSGNDDYSFQPNGIPIVWGGKQQSCKLSEYRGVVEGEIIPVIEDIASLQVSGWARLVPESPDEVEYCIDLYFSEPFYYFPYVTHEMVPDKLGNEPYFGIMCTPLLTYIPIPIKDSVKVIGYREYAPTEGSDLHLIDIEKIDITPRNPCDKEPLGIMLWVKLDLSDTLGLSQIRWKYRLPKVVPSDLIMP
jgi:hypothetical protein